jgi:hypothetical protein
MQLQRLLPPEESGSDKSSCGQDVRRLRSLPKGSGDQMKSATDARMTSVYLRV